MDDRTRNREEAGEPIWIRYSTQFTTGGRTHTVEMSVPLPVGATPELRERLFREAEAGLSHLMNHVENRIPSLLQQARTSVPASPPLPTPVVKSRAEPSSQRESLAPASQGSSQAQVQPSNVSQIREFSPDLITAQQKGTSSRSGGLSMPSMPGAGNGNLSLPEFIQAIKELGMSPRQAMDHLKVKSLSTGINLREALDRLEYIVAQGGGDVARDQAELQAGSSQAERAHHVVHAPAIEDRRGEEDIDFNESPAPVFDEEIEPDEEEEDFSDVALDDEEEIALTTEERHKARTIIDSLREMRGATTVNSSRLKALTNVIGDQISQAELQTLIRGIWGTPSPNRLKVDQVEELIHWAKQDEFVSEVEAVLMLLEEG